MALWQGQSARKSTGGRMIRARGKRRYEISRERLQPVIGETRTKVVRTKGYHNHKTRMLAGNLITVNKADGTSERVEATNVVENPTNLNYVRRNVLTKGAVVETKLGNVRITSRPGQSGALAGVVVS